MLIPESSAKNYELQVRIELTTLRRLQVRTEPLETLRQAGPECLFQPMLELISVRGSKSAQGNWTEMYLPGLESQIRPPTKNCI